MAKKPETLLWRLLRAADAACIARAEAQWTNGYRAARLSVANTQETSDLYDKEQRQWKHVGYIEGRMRRVFLAVLRDARKTKTKARRREAKE